MTRAVICYVPGSGGVRLLNMMIHAVSAGEFLHLDHYHDQIPTEWAPNSFEPAQILRQLPEKPFADRAADHSKPNLFPKYHNDNLIGDDGKIITPYHSEFQATPCHCMDYAVVERYHPDRYQIKIVCDIVISLKRWWIVYGQHSISKHPQIAPCHDASLSDLETDDQKLIAKMLIMHLAYYNDCYDTKADIVLDIRNDNDAFSSFMRQEFDLCQHTVFDRVAQYLLDQDIVFRRYFDNINCKIS